jgi:hypothetical protein
LLSNSFELKRYTKEGLGFLIRNKEGSSNAMIANCVLAGDSDLLNNDASVFTELVEKIGSLTKSARSSLKKV